MIIGVDFDGTLAKHKYPEIGEEVPLAIEYCKEFQARGAQLILFTMRSEINHLKEAVDWCKERGLEFWSINENPHQSDWTKSPKPYCNIYIDDLAINCPLTCCPDERYYVDWSIVGPQVLRLMEGQALGVDAC